MKPEKLKAVVNLARHGATEGERNAALNVLSKLGLSLDDFENETDTVEVNYSYKDTFEKKLIFQIYFKFINTNEIKYSQINPKKISFCIPRHLEQKIESSICSVLKHYRREIKKFHAAFIHSNDLYPKKDPDPDYCSKWSMSESMDIIDMASGITKIFLENLLNKK